MKQVVRALIFGGTLVTGGALLLGLGAAGVAGAAPAAPAVTTVAATPAPAGTADATSPVKVRTVKLDSGTGTGAERTYEALVLDDDGARISGASLDLGGLADNPDLRVKTTKMVADKADPTVYRATVTFPSDGDWVMVVRVHEPTEAVELFSTKITGAGAGVGHDLAANPSKRAVLKADPYFYQRYNGTPQLGTVDPTITATAGGHGSTTSAAGTSTIDSVHGDGFSALASAFAILHSFGAIAWMVSVLGLVLANRVGSGLARRELTRFIGRHYTVLAGGGLLVLVFSGIQNVLNASPGLTHPSQLIDSNIGMAYLAVFGLKMALVVGSVVTSYRLGRLLPTPARIMAAPRLASLGAMANDEPSPVVYRLAEANASLGALIIGCVVVLGQLHHALQ